MKFLQQRDHREKRLLEELKNEKARFAQASQNALQSVRYDLVVESWLKSYPVQSIALIAAAGFAAGYVIAKTRPVAALDITAVF